MASLANRAKDKAGLGADAFNPKKTNKDDTAKKACEKWLDVRSSAKYLPLAKAAMPPAYPSPFTRYHSIRFQHRAGQHHQHPNHQKRERRRRRQQTAPTPWA